MWRESRGQHEPKSRSTRKSCMRVRASPPRHGCRTHRSAPHTPTGSRRPADARSKGFTISLPSSSQTFCPLTKPAWRRLHESRGREGEKKKKKLGEQPPRSVRCASPPPPRLAHSALLLRRVGPGFRGDRRYEGSSADELMCVLLKPQLARISSSSSGGSSGAVRKWK